MKKYVLCRPKGGLNDLLCQIAICWDYAERFARSLVVDTRQTCLGDDFSFFFSPIDQSALVRFDAADDVMDLLNRSSCYPPELYGRLRGYRSEYRQDCNFVDDVTGRRLRFDLSRSYDESVLVHEQCGGGTDSFRLLSRLRLSKHLAERVGAVLANIGDGYDAAHIRNTDYETDYTFLFGKIARKTAGRKLLICSDNPAVVEHAQSYFARCDVFTIAKLPDTNSRPLHDRESYATAKEIRNAAELSLIDLLSLGNAANLYYTDTKDGFPSGFSRLAAHLCTNRQLMQSLLGGHLPSPRRRTDGNAHYIRPIRTRLKKIVPRFLRQ
ncbi:nodulation protein NodZ [Hoeflea poritis]|uniref:Uncharacterized protein n=1 Tax=Hoeflea poritis TaxID=2993659 RepID=A0ABT4VGZ0_9HYPH|nr:nodulation protein NodZ [Hoeflea poritis]MDA4843965.1 hypothetical protein [Hoeflea poritis]